MTYYVASTDANGVLLVEPVDTEYLDTPELIAQQAFAFQDAIYFEVEPVNTTPIRPEVLERDRAWDPQERAEVIAYIAHLEAKGA